MAARRRTVRPAKRRKARSAAQRANDKRLGAMARSRSRGARSAAPKRRRKRRSNGMGIARSYSAAPRRRRSAPRAAPRRRRSSSRSFGRISGNIVTQTVDMLKSGAIAAGGALAIDAVMGQLNTRILPDTWNTKYNADGTPNYRNAAIKAALTVGAGYAGARFTSGATRDMILRGAAGALTIQAYDTIKALIPADTLPMGAVPRRMSGVRPAPRLSNMVPATGVAQPLGQPPIYTTRAVASVVP